MSVAGVSLLDVVFPVDCAGCGVRHGPACAACRELLATAPRLAWPSPAPAGLPPPWSVAAYDGAVRALLLAYKEHGVVALSRALAVPLAAAITAAAGTGRAVVVPIPASRAAIRNRGDDVTGRLVRRAVEVARRGGQPVRIVPALSHVRRVADSAGLDAASRAANLAGAFALRPGAARVIGGSPVVIADDVITTGTTLAEAARGLRAGGVGVAGTATVAATRRRGGVHPQ